MAEPETEIKEWWRTSIIDMEPGKISLETSYRRVDWQRFLSTNDWLMLRGELPSLDETKLLEAALVGGVDHGLKHLP